MFVVDYCFLYVYCFKQPICPQYPEDALLRVRVNYLFDPMQAPVMRAAAITDLTSEDYLNVIDVPDPEPGAGEAVVQVESASLNHHDLWLSTSEDRVEETALPFVLGVDLAGTVAAVGPDVSTIQPGDRVVLTPNETCGTCRFCRDGPENLCAEYQIYHGAFAEKALVDASRLVHLPDNVSTRVASALPVAYMTTLHMLRRAEVSPGDRVFVPGAAGGVGVAAVQLIDTIGATSIGTSSSRDKLDRLTDVGLDHAVHTDDPAEMRARVRELGPVDATLNHLGGPYTQVGLDVLRRGGRMVVVGQTAGGTSEIDIPDTYRRHTGIIGSTMGTQPELERIVSLVADGAFEPVIDEEYPLADAGAAFRAMDERSVFGKLLIRP